MDTLGAPSQLVDLDTLPNWGHSCEDELSGPDTAAETDTIRSPFLYSKNINGKEVLCFLRKDVALLNCTAIVNASIENPR